MTLSLPSVHEAARGKPSPMTQRSQSCGDRCLPWVLTSSQEMGVWAGAVAQVVREGTHEPAGPAREEGLVARAVARWCCFLELHSCQGGPQVGRPELHGGSRGLGPQQGCYGRRLSAPRCWLPQWGDGHSPVTRWGAEGPVDSQRGSVALLQFDVCWLLSTSLGGWEPGWGRAPPLGRSPCFPPAPAQGIPQGTGGCLCHPTEESS